MKPVSRRSFLAVVGMGAVLVLSLWTCAAFAGEEKVLCDFETPDSILSGDTADVYFPRAVEILKRENIDPRATMEVFASRAGTASRRS